MTPEETPTIEFLGGPANGKAINHRWLSTWINVPAFGFGIAVYQHTNILTSDGLMLYVFVGKEE